MHPKNQGINKNYLPELRVDKSSPNTSLITKEFFEIMGADLSYARVRRPMDNGRTERFFGTSKQEEIGIHFYNNNRPHQALWNFTPAHIHKVNNNTLIIKEF